MTSGEGEFKRLCASFSPADGTLGEKRRKEGTTWLHRALASKRGVSELDPGWMKGFKIQFTWRMATVHWPWGKAEGSLGVARPSRAFVRTAPYKGDVTSSSEGARPPAERSVATHKSWRTSNSDSTLKIQRRGSADVMQWSWGEDSRIA